MNAFERLLQRLTLRPGDDPGWWIGGAGSGGVTANNRLYGGLVIAQAVVAAARTFPDRQMHSMHANFLRPGRPDSDITYQVIATKHGRSFGTCTVAALQDGKPILTMLASFSAFEGGPSHQATMPEAPAPLTLPNRDALRGRDPSRSAVIDVRLCDPLTGSEPLPPAKRVWMKPTAPLPEDPVMQLAVLVYATDRTLLGTAWRPHADRGQLAGASLDHSIWIHAPARFDDWLLYTMDSPAAAHGRGLVHGHLYRADGTLIASVSQQGTLTFSPR